MKQVTETAMKALIKKAADTQKSEDSMRFTQSALNLAHVMLSLEGVKRQDK